MESLEQRIQRVIHEEIELEPYNPAWPALFQREKQHLLDFRVTAFDTRRGRGVS